ncbi:MAG TPA: T9SS type A sorting domain-containing protein [Parafilimonas sp.]|nr:T9SS type A sorting domain-containing protein [Parafilimonas sp.]
MKTLYLFIASLLFLCMQTSAQTWQWTHPEKNSDPPANAQAHDVEIDASGNVYVLGDFDDSLFLNDNFITKGYGSYLAKYDSTGKKLWHKLMINTAGDGNIKATDLTVNSTGVYITGKYSPSKYSAFDCSIADPQAYKIGNLNFNSLAADVGLFITKFNSNGKIIWNKTATDPFTCEYGKGIVSSYPIITSDYANNIICGFVYGSSNPSFLVGGDVIPLRGKNNALNCLYLVVTKYNSSGSLQWSNYAGGGFTFEPPNNYYGAVSDCFSLTSDNNNNIFFVGQAGDSTFFGPHLFRASGAQFPTFISKISSAGAWQLTKELSSNTSNPGNSLIYPDLLCADSQNNIYALVNLVSTGGQIPTLILGDTVPDPAEVDAFAHYLVKIKNNGTLTWHKGFNGNSFSYTNANSICYANNSLYIAGDVSVNAPVFGSLTVLRNPLSGGQEYFVAKADASGDFKWVAAAGSMGTSQLPYQNGMEGLAVRVFNNNIYTAGYYIGGITTLGNLNGSYIPPYNSHYRNIFYGEFKDQYVKVGTVTPTQLIPGCTITIPFTAYGLTFSNKNKFTAELSNVNGDFITATAIGSIKSTGTGNITATIPASLAYGSGYRIRIRSTDTLKTGLNYYAYADTPYVLTLTCLAPSSGFVANNITSTSATLNWDVVNCAKGYKVQYRKKGTTAWTAINVTTNTGTLNLTGLTANTTYQWRVATKCKNNGATSFSQYSAIKQFTTTAAFASAETSDAVTTAIQGLQLKIEPNPASSTALLVINSKVTNASVVITDLAGKVIWKQNGINTTKLNLPVQHFSLGAYMVKLSNGDKTYTVKLIKQ